MLACLFGSISCPDTAFHLGDMWGSMGWLHQVLHAPNMKANPNLLPQHPEPSNGDAPSTTTFRVTASLVGLIHRHPVGVTIRSHPAKSIFSLDLFFLPVRLSPPDRLLFPIHRNASVFFRISSSTASNAGEVPTGQADPRRSSLPSGFVSLCCLVP